MTQSTALPPLIVRLEPEAHHCAKDLAAQQSTSEKGKRVYLNTLAVYAVARFLESMGIEIDLNAGDCSNPLLCGLLDATDLVLPGMGYLECRPVLPGESFLNLPGEVKEDLIGCVAVQFGQRLELVELLGFAKAVDAINKPEILDIAELLPLDVLIDELNELEAERMLRPLDLIENDNKVLEELQQRLRNFGDRMAEIGWQTVESLSSQLNPKAVNLGFRSGRNAGSEDSDTEAIAALIHLLQTNSDELVCRQAAGVLGEIANNNQEAIKALTELLEATDDEETRWQAAIALGKIDPNNPKSAVRRAKLIDLGMQLGSEAVALIVGFMPKADNIIEVFVQVQPTRDRLHLPPHLKISILSQSGEIIMEAEARSDVQGRGIDDCIQLRRSFSLSTHFRVKVALQEASITEDFII